MNNNSKEKKVIIKYDLETKKGNKSTKSKKIKISAKGNKKINVYQISDVKKEDILTLELSIKEYDFLLELQQYIVISFVISVVFAIILYFYIKTVEKEN